ncbi:amidase [Microbacterium endophyticum]|uniref:Amidase n=1 Tax=Microbacterium endophyticum TaxID=1526412 RepID=A0A7W4YLE7_9MICO|nr:amidase family protein [Microbacterium endophyticum]MBB2975355.1 amidase [Microbacterium endophyticum]NIK35626.1 amidase [Microbacterium endophyticum]
MTQLTEMDAGALADAIRTRVTSATEVVDAHLRRIERLNPVINAIVSLRAQEALDDARECDRLTARGLSRGAFHGVPMAVKDLMDVTGLRTTYGSRIYADNIARADSVITGKLRAAGTVFVGKTNTPEFGVGSHTFNDVFGVTRNPYDLSRSAGGSSGGAAAAVTSGMLPIADGSDLGGSIRNPASFGNLVGLRPTAGRVASARPGNAWDPGSVLGPIARSVRDAALFMSVVSAPERRAPLSIDEDPSLFLSLQPRSFEGKRIAFSADLGGLPLDTEVRAATEEAARLAERLGAEVVPVDIDMREADFVFETFRSLELLDAHDEDARLRPNLVKQTVKDDISWADDFTADTIVRAASARTQLFRRFQALFEEFDLLLAPCVQVLPFPVDWEYPAEIDGVAMDKYYSWQRSCSRITATAMPALSMPMRFSEAGLPIGVQFVGPYRGDRLLLEYALTWEGAVSDVISRRPFPIEES